MSTSIQLIMTAQDVLPLDVCHKGYTQKVVGLIILDAPALRRRVEERAGRKLLWEEWLDVRERWCARYRAGQWETPRGVGSLEAVCELAGLRGYNHLLLEEF